jgi:hypothetical protein
MYCAFLQINHVKEFVSQEITSRGKGKMVDAGKTVTMFGWKTGIQLCDPWQCDIFLHKLPKKCCAVYTVKCILVT